MVIPVVSGGIAVTAIFACLASWNRFLFALLMTAIRSPTTPVVIANFQTQFGLDGGSMTALAAVYSIPVILLTLLLQRKIAAGDDARRRQGLEKATGSLLVTPRGITNHKDAGDR